MGDENESDVRSHLHASVARMKVKGAALETQMEVLDKLQGPEDFFKFLQASGLSHDEIQRSLSDPQQAESLLEKSLNSKLGIQKEEDKELKKTLKTIDTIHDLVVKNKPREKPPPSKPKTKPLKKEIALKVPAHRLKLEEDKITLLVGIW
uniref:Uncharacterized protein n=1 Tax=Lotharella globosa TaxID=91324 RepID=A0A7S3ZER7_9EUKA